MKRTRVSAPRRSVRRVAVVTGTRAEYGLLRPVMEAIEKQRGLRLQLVVTGMHLLPDFGRTIDDIRRDGWRIDARVKMQDGRDHALDQAAGLSRGVAGIAKYFEQAQTDIAVVLGDRIEAMAGALAAVTTGRILTHIHAGDLAPGDLDERLRHAITKLAHLHFTATRKARQRIIRMGERETHVHWVGAPGLDRLMGMVKRYGRPTERLGRALIVQHPCGRSAACEKRVMNAVLRAVTHFKLPHTIVYPNSDRGHSGIVEAIQAQGQRCTNGSVRIVRSLPRDEYLQCLIDADVLVGNSSSGIIEAATAGTPCVNVGQRQDGRQRSGRSVIDAAESLPAIRDAIAAALRTRPIMGRSTAYGNGDAGRSIARLLASTPLSARLRHKRNAY